MYLLLLCDLENPMGSERSELHTMNAVRTYFINNYLTISYDLVMFPKIVVLEKYVSIYNNC